MPGRSGTEVIRLDLSMPAMRERLQEGRARQALRNGMVLKALLGAVLVIGSLVTLLAVLRR